MYEILESKERISIEHLFQIWCLYLSYKESYEQNTADVSFLDVYDITCTIEAVALWLNLQYNVVKSYTELLYLPELNLFWTARLFEAISLSKSMLLECDALFYSLSCYINMHKLKNELLASAAYVFTAMCSSYTY